MRDLLSTWVREFPKALIDGPEAFRNSPLRALVTREIPIALDEAIPGLIDRYRIKGSIGQGGWTHTPWVAVLDPAITDTVQEGFYVVYLLSHNGERLYLSLNQGCTARYKAVGQPKAAEELKRRAALMRGRLPNERSQFGRVAIDLGSDVWRGQLYEAGEVVSVEYHSLALPTEEVLVDDLKEALRLYKIIDNAGGWWAEDEILQEAHTDGFVGTLEQVKRYRQHRSIERKTNHSKAVKRAQGVRCRGCDWQMDELYGAFGKGIAQAHHLVPLATLADGEVARFDPKKDFVVLCPNCHSVIHKLPDVSDLAALRAVVAETDKIPRRTKSPAKAAKR